MKYTFPTDLHIDEVRSVINRHNERTGTRAFIEAVRDHYTVFNYIVSFDGSFPTPDTKDPALNREYAILRECRGLTFSPSGRILARKYHKFHNLDEKPETQTQNIDFSAPHWVLAKLDGSMITPVIYDNGEMSFHTKMGATDVAKPVEDFVAANSVYQRMARYFTDSGKTPIYEWCSRKNRIIIDHPEDQLVLTAVRDNITGAYMSYEALVEHAALFGVPVVKALPGGITDVEEFKQLTYDLKGAEGWVIRFADGHMLKIKSAEYCQLHKVKEMLQWEKDIWALVLSDKLDDAKAFMDAADRARVENFATALEKRVQETADRLNWIVIAARDNVGDSKKRFALEIVASHRVDQERGLLFKIWDGRDPVAVVKEHLRGSIGTLTRVNEVRPVVGGLTWEQYRGSIIDLDG